MTEGSLSCTHRILLVQHVLGRPGPDLSRRGLRIPPIDSRCMKHLGGLSKEKGVRVSLLLPERHWFWPVYSPSGSISRPFAVNAEMESPACSRRPRYCFERPWDIYALYTYPIASDVASESFRERTRRPPSPLRRESPRSASEPHR